MNELLKVILSLSISGTVLILVLFLCRPFVKHRLSKRWQYYIWLIVAARLLLSVTSDTSLVGTLFQHFNTGQVPINTGEQTKLDTRIPAEADLAGYGRTNISMRAETKAEKPEDRQIGSVFLMIWLLAAAGLLIRKVTVYQSFVKYLKAGRIEVTDMALWERVGKLVGQTGIRGTVGVYTNSLISSPLLTGFFHPCIMLPTAELPDADFDYTILHELTHYKRRDMFYKWLVQIAVCLHWFNPFVYLMGREVNRACELSCDETVIKPLDLQGRRAYGDTLLNAVKSGGSYRDKTASVPLNDSIELLKERLEAVMIYKKKTKLATALASALTILFLCGFFFTGAYAADFKKAADKPVQSIETAITIPDGKQDITVIDIQAAIGNLTVRYGDRLQIETGAELIGHASFSCENGTFFYRDNFESSNLSYDDTDREAYNITLTIPGNSELKTISVDVGYGSIDLKNIRTDKARLAGTNKINLDGFQSGTLSLNSTLADISAAGISIQKELILYLYGSTAVVSGTIKGSVLIDSAGISSIAVTFLDADKTNYLINSTWEPESQHREPGKLLLENGNAGILIDGVRHDTEYSGSNLNASNKVTIVSRELMPMENISIDFIK